MEKLVEISKNLKDNYELLFQLFRSDEFDYKKIEYSKDLEEGLLFLFTSNIARPKSFEIILYFNKKLALKYINDLYFYEERTGDSRYPFHDLDLLFSDIVELYGEEELRKFLELPNVSKLLKKTKRIREAVEFALE